MKKLLSFISTIAITAPAVATVISCGESKQEEPEIAPKNIGDQLKITDLGQFSDKPTNNEIFKKIQELNPSIQLDITQLEIAFNDNGKITVKVKTDSTIYQAATFEFTYRIKDKRQNLNDLILVTDLGSFETVGDTPTSNEILNVVKVKNPKTKIIESELEIVNVGKTTAILKSIDDSKIYLPIQVKLKYTFSKKDTRATLNDVLKVTNLGEIKTNDDEPTITEIIQAIKFHQENQNLNENEIEVINLTKISALVQVKKNSLVYKPGKQELSYQAIKIDRRARLSELISKKDLGSIDAIGTTPSYDQVQTTINNQYPELNWEEIILSEISPTSAKLTVKDNSTIYKPESFKITYKVNDTRLELNQIITSIDLGTIHVVGTTPSYDQVQATINNQYPELNWDEVILSDITQASAKLTIKPESKIYKSGELLVTYLIHDTRLELNQIITNHDLGTINVIGTTPSYDQVKTTINNQYSNLVWNEIILNEINSTSAKLSVKDNSMIYKPISFKITYKIKDTRLALNEIISNSNLGTINVIGTTPSSNEILAKLPKLNKDEITIEGINETSAIIKVKPNSKIYQPGEMKVHYLVHDTRLVLSTIITETKLGIFSPNPNDWELLNRIKELNPNIDLTQLIIVENENNQLTIEVKPNSKIYQQENITFSYTIDLRINLESVLTITNLGEFGKTEPTNKELLNRIKELNLEVNINQLEVKDKTNNQATIQVIENSNIYFNKSFKVNFEVVPFIALKSVLTTTDLGLFKTIRRANPTNQEILNKIKQLNPNVNINKLEVIINNDNNQATIQVIKNSKFYEPEPVNVTYLVLNESYATSFIDSAGDMDYIYQSKDDYVNNDHKPGTGAQQDSPEIIFAKINVKNYNTNSIDEFFSNHSIQLKYNWIANVWKSSLSGDANGGWWFKGGKEILPENWPFKNQILKWSRKNEIGHNQKSLGNSATNSTYQSEGKIDIWMEIDEVNSTIIIKGKSSAVYQWEWWETRNFAAYSTIKATEIKIISK